MTYWKDENKHKKLPWLAPFKKKKLWIVTNPQRPFRRQNWSLWSNNDLYSSNITTGLCGFAAVWLSTLVVLFLVSPPPPTIFVSFLTVFVAFTSGSVFDGKLQFGNVVTFSLCFTLLLCWRSIWNCSQNCFVRWQKTWSSGYGRRPIFGRSWIRMYIGRTIFSISFLFKKLFWCLLKKTENKRNRGRGWPVLFSQLVSF